MGHLYAALHSVKGAQERQLCLQMHQQQPRMARIAGRQIFRATRWLSSCLNMSWFTSHFPQGQVPGYLTWALGCQRRPGEAPLSDPASHAWEW
jgi:hypothetical protein